MKRNLLVAAFVFACAAAATLIWPRRQSDWEFVSRATSFDFPVGTEYLAHFDNAEWFVVGVLRLPESSVREFIQKHRFVPGERADLITVSSLPERYRKIPERGDVLSASGQKEYQAWQAVLDTQSRLLWIHVTYPDWSGDHPGTAPQPPNKSVQHNTGSRPSSVVSPASASPSLLGPRG